MDELPTERLLLRRWRDADLGPWAAMNADPQVRQHLGPVLTRDQSDLSVARFEKELAERGFGWWALEVRATSEFVGFAGLDVVDETAPLSGIEVGWRLSRAVWGNGYASEAGRACLEFGFDRLDLSEIVAITTADNLRSQAVMQRLGMTRDPADDFQDPAEPIGPLQQNVVFRIARTHAS